MKAEDNEFPSVLFAEQAAAPTTPGAGLWRAFFKSDGLYVVDDAGTVTGPFGTGGGGSATFLGCKVHASTAISLTTATLTSLNFDTEDYDVSGMHSTSSNTNRITVPQAGVYRVTGSVQFAGNATKDRLVGFSKNGTGAAFVNDGAQRAWPASAATTDDAYVTATTDLALAAGDYVTLIVYQNSGGSLNAKAASFSVYYLPGSS